MVHDQRVQSTQGRFRYAGNCTLLWTILFFFGKQGLVLGASEAKKGTVEVLARGNGEIVWLCERRVENAGDLLFLAYCRLADSAHLAFRPLRIPALSGRVVVSAVRGESLHVFFSDGTHMRFTPPGGTRSVLGASVRGLEVALPDRTVPRAVVSDAATQTLYALVSGEQAAQLPTKIAIPVEDPDAEGSDASGVSTSAESAENVETKKHASAVEPDEPLVVAPFAFARYEGGVWLLDRWAPDGVGEAGKLYGIWVQAGEILMVYRGAQGEPVVEYASSSREGPWSSAVHTEISSTAHALGTGWVQSSPVLVVREFVDHATRVVGLRRVASNWTALSPFAGLSQRAGELDRASSIALMGPLAVVAGVSKERVVEAGSWSLTTGEQLGRVGPVVAFTPSTVTAIDRHLRTVVPFVVFATILIVVFVTRRDGGLFRVALCPTQQVADLQARFFALVLDLLIMAPIWGGILYLFMYDDLSLLSMFEQMRNPTPAMELILPVVSVVAALYGLVFEISMQTTPGKRIMGLWVVAEGGNRAGYKALVVRNLMRVLEFQFPAVAILVFLTPTRQRLGDVLSRTIVVRGVSILPHANGQNADDSELSE